MAPFVRCSKQEGKHDPLLVATVAFDVQVAVAVLFLL